MENYYKTKLKKIGKWNLLPLDVDNWMTEDTSRYFREIFGFGKGILVIITMYDGGWQHVYVPEYYIEKLHVFVKQSTSKDYKSLEDKLLKFYKLKEELKINVPKLNYNQVSKLSNDELIELYIKNKDWIHRATVFDQFGFIAENYWNPIMKDILVNKFGIKYNSDEYYESLFILTKPDKISTTLTEKRDTLLEAIEIKKGKDINNSSQELAKKYGWMIVSTYGEPWDNKYFEEELNKILSKPIKDLEDEYDIFKSHTLIRNNEIQNIVKKYGISDKDLQIFIDFGLTLDTRNEAEYLVSYCGYYLLPFYKEISKRLFLSIKQLRTLYEHEVIDALKGNINYEKIIHERRRICAYGYDKDMSKREYFETKEAEKLFKYLEGNVDYVQSGENKNGLCASTGKAVGEIKVVISHKDNYKVKKGDIMVSVATMVDHLPAMKNASAIITEVGSLTCHAAVVSREFNIPCIVGLKNATKIFKDGEKVELDANKGIVRKLN